MPVLSGSGCNEWGLWVSQLLRQLDLPGQQPLQDTSFLYPGNRGAVRSKVNVQSPLRDSRVATGTDVVQKAQSGERGDVD
ncbi:hypothetical protein KUCAC02_032560 [Chaenocephalus aceratus]|nr:hypothetical protein KUCAC02_032560 [Chaenocephalus aceratus]